MAERAGVQEYTLAGRVGGPQQRERNWGTWVQDSRRGAVRDSRTGW